MRVTRRYWSVASLVVGFALWGLVLDRPLALVGTTLVGGWLLARQYWFITQARSVLDRCAIEQTVAHERITAGERTAVSVGITLREPAPLPIRVTSSPPVTATGDVAAVTIAAGDTTATTMADLEWPVAGSYTFDPPTVTFQDPLGLFTQALDQGPAPTVTVEPRAPRNIHVGTGGEPIAAGFGEHTAEGFGSGLTPAEVRQYVPGDAVRQIDWKATARLDEPHVREFEAETDRETILVVDHRQGMATGPAGQRKLDFARQVAVAVADSARQLSDPLGCYTVGDEGLTASYRPRTNADHHAAIRTQLDALEPTAPAASADRARSVAAPEQARRAAERLDGEDPFSTRLRPFLDRPEAYVQRIADRPLFAAVRTAHGNRGSQLFTVIVTDDTARTEVRETVKFARLGGGRVLVFLTPSVLYDQQPGSLEAAYEAYSEFESFRRDLAAMGRVTALEVGPDDRLSTILAAGRQQREATQP